MSCDKSQQIILDPEPMVPKPPKPYNFDTDGPAGASSETAYGSLFYFSCFEGSLEFWLWTLRLITKRRLTDVEQPAEDEEFRDSSCRVSGRVVAEVKGEVDDGGWLGHDPEISMAI